MKVLLAMLMAALLAACGASSDPPPEDSAAPSDLGADTAAPVDTAPPADTASPPIDTAAPPVDTAAPDDSESVDAALTACESYCALVAEHCTDDLAPVFSGSCAEACAAWATGEVGDTKGDSVACRITHATLAADDPATHCPHASPEGGGVCVDAPPTWCELSCAAIAEGCPEVIEETVEACVAGCEANEAGECADAWAAVEACVPADTAWECDGDGGVAPAGGICEAERVAMAACEAVLADPCLPDPCEDGDICVADGEEGYSCLDWCTTTCATKVAACAGKGIPEADLEADCLTYCQASDTEDGPCADAFAALKACYPPNGEWSCHALVTAPTDCMAEHEAYHACWPTPCEEYCETVKANCSGENAPDFGDDPCLLACWFYPQDEDINALSGDSLQCRMNYAKMAEPIGPSGALNSKLNCPNAGPDGGEQCVPCLPQCDVAVCGADGCGGMCGVCDEGQSCEDGSCCTPDAAVACCEVTVFFFNAPGVCAVDSCGNVDTANGEACTSGACEAGECLSWCQSACIGLKEDCPDATASVEACVAGCEADLEGQCAVEWAAVQECVPAVVSWECGAEGGAFPIVPVFWEGATDCATELLALGECSAICDVNSCGKGLACHASLGGGYTCNPGPTWCAGFCEGVAGACGEGMEGTVEECVTACEANAAGDCDTSWKDVQKCLDLDQALVCDADYGAVAADGSCVDVFIAFGACESAPPE